MQAAGALAGREHGPACAPQDSRPVRLVARALFLLTKPRIIELLLVTTVPAMLLAQRGLPPAGLAAVTLLGGRSRRAAPTR